MTGLEISKTYADNTTVVKTYDAYNRLATETDARGNVKTHAYEHARGLHIGTTYTIVDGTAATSARSFTYNHLGQMTQLVDNSGVSTFAYNTYGERESDSLVVDGDTHLIAEQLDNFGRSTGFVYSKNGARFSTPSQPATARMVVSAAPASPTAEQLSSTSAAPICCTSSPSRTT